MNIIHIISNPEWGGGERYALDLCVALRSHGHCVGVVCRNKEAVLTPLRQAGFTPAVMRLGGSFDVFSPVHIARMVRRFEGSAPVNIHVHNFKDAALALKVKALCHDTRPVRVVCTRHLVKSGKLRRLPLYRSLDALIFVSERARAEFAQSGLDTVGINMAVVPNALPAGNSLPAADPASEPPLLLYIGRLAEEKGVHTFVDALSLITDLDWKARICGQGEGRYVMPLIRRCRKVGIADRVEWPGHVADVSAEIAQAQIGVVPTLTPEAFGLSIIEMMRQGLPVVSTDNGAQPEIITSGRDGLLVPPGDASALAAGLRSLIADPALRCRIGAAGRERFESAYTYPTFYNEITGYYR